MKKKNNWIWIVVALIVLLFLFGIWNNSKEDKKTNSDAQKYERLEAEVNIMNELMVDIVNRNDYEWTNMKVIANDYYTCIEGMNLKPNEKWTLKTYWCKDSQGNGGIGTLTSLEKIDLICDEGSKTFIVE